MYVNSINELILHGVFDRGVPNQERIVLRVQDNLNLAAYGLLLTVYQSNSYTPLPDQFFWFGETILDPDTWVFVYTGAGFPRMTKTSVTNEPAYVLHWNREHAVFHQDTLQPTLIRIDAATNGKTELPLLLPAV
jgi:uncharacterized protein YodC (DUF2158 family)